MPHVAWALGCKAAKKVDTAQTLYHHVAGDHIRSQQGYFVLPSLMQLTREEGSASSVQLKICCSAQARAHLPPTTYQLHSLWTPNIWLCNPLGLAHTFSFQAHKHPPVPH